jgi:polysaccharide biosynthesis protein PslH
MNILFVCHRFPFPPTRGGKIRPFQMIRHLSQSHSVTVASLAHTQQELEEGAGLKQHCQEVIAEVLPSSVRWKNALAALPTRTPSSAAYFWSPKLHERIQQAARNKKFHVVMVHCAFVARYVKDIPCDFRLLDYGDLDSGKWLEYSMQRAFPFSTGYKLEARKLRKYEKALASQFDHCTFTARGELEEFLGWELKAPVSLIPNGVDADYFCRLSERPAQAATVVFLGRMDYFPNIQGIIDFAHNVFPRIRSKFPAARLRIIGSNPVREVRELSTEPGIEVTGSVPDVRPCLADAAVAVAPLKIARGTQNKILECMSMGIPVVSSPQAARGVQATPGEHLLVGNDHSDFAAQVLKLLADSELRDRIAASARQQLRNGHSWARSMQLLDGVLAGGTSAIGNKQEALPAMQLS